MKPDEPKMSEIIAIIGNAVDGPLTFVTPHGLKHIPGNKPDVALYASIASSAARLENQAAREAITNAVLPPLRAELHASIGERAYEE